MDSMRTCFTATGHNGKDRPADPGYSSEQARAPTSCTQADPTFLFAILLLYVPCLQIHVSLEENRRWVASRIAGVQRS